MAGDEQDRLGAVPAADGSCRFTVWAPAHPRVEVRIVDGERVEVLERDRRGFHRADLEAVGPGSRYLYRLPGGVERPDPASRLQPEGVHGASAVFDPAFEWTDRDWRGVPLRDYVLYELHVGTFTPEGTFDAVIPHLERLRETGVTAIEIMPVGQFPGSRNWGYDGVFPFAVQTSYGGPRGLQRLVDACHRRGLAVVLDVVYNHLGPEGNHLADFGPYFTDAYRTPWGRAVNFDGPGSDEVRRYFIENALQWIRDFRVDALRLDAVHAILDRSPRPFLEELADEVRAFAGETGREVALIAESDANDPRLIAPSSLGGYGLDSMWCDDFHHAVHVLLTGERNGYYADFGRVEHLARAWERGMTYAGDRSAFRQRRHGRPIERLRPEQVVVCVQNHDQVGNRLRGDRLGTLVDLESEKLAAGLVALSPYLPLLFMGQEYGETAPFLYFVSHGDPALVEAVRRGRREEFRSFGWKGRIPDPQGEATFRESFLDHELRNRPRHTTLLGLYRRLFDLRRRLPGRGTDDAAAFEEPAALFVRRDRRAWMVFSFAADPAVLSLPVLPGRWERSIASAETAWGGPGTGLPPGLQSEGEVWLKVPGRSFFVYTLAADHGEPNDRNLAR